MLALGSSYASQMTPPSLLSALPLTIDADRNHHHIKIHGVASTAILSEKDSSKSGLKRKNFQNTFIVLTEFDNREKIYSYVFKKKSRAVCVFDSFTSNLSLALTKLSSLRKSIRILCSEVSGKQAQNRKK